jgi:hypothetical protein
VIVVRFLAHDLWPITALSTCHLFVVVPQSNHMIQLTQPAHVIAAVVWTLEAARGKRGMQG